MPCQRDGLVQRPAMCRVGIVTITKYGRIPGGRRYWRHEAATRSPLPPPVLRRDHQLRCLAVPRVQRVIVTGKLRSYGVARRQLLPGVEHRQSRYLNNRAENSHRPTRRCERQMQRFKSSEQAQEFLSAHSFIHGHFHPRRHQLVAHAHRATRSDAFKIWHQETCAQCAV